MFAAIQGVQLGKVAVGFGGPVILIMPVSGLHMELDHLKYEATTYFMLATAYISRCLSFIFGAVAADFSPDVDGLS